jgi:hypothetical protein
MMKSARGATLAEIMKTTWLAGAKTSTLRETARGV